MAQVSVQSLGAASCYNGGWSTGYREDTAGYFGYGGGVHYAMAFKISVPDIGQYGNPGSLSIYLGTSYNQYYGNSSCRCLVSITSVDPRTTGAYSPSSVIVQQSVSYTPGGAVSVSLGAGSLHAGTYYVWFSEDGSGWAETNAYDFSASLSYTIAATGPSSTTVTPYVALGNPMTIDISASRTNYTHKLAYTVVRLTDITNMATLKNAEYFELTANAKTGYSWTVPITLASMIKDSISAALVIRCSTFDGTSELSGSPTYNTACVVSVPGSIKPSISNISIDKIETGIDVLDTGALSSMNGGSPLYLQGYSSVHVDVTADTTNDYGATISNCVITCDGVSYDASGGSDATVSTWFADTDVLANPGSIYITAVITDSRGRTDTFTTSVNVIPYSRPTLKNISCYRSDTSGQASTTGTEISAAATAIYSSCVGQNSIISIIARYRPTGGTWVEPATTLVSAAPNVFITNKNSTGDDLSPTVSYVVQFAVTDLLNTTLIEQVIPTMNVTYHARAGGGGIAVGKISEHEDAFEIGYHKMFVAPGIYGDEDVYQMTGEEGQIYFKLLE